MDPDAALAEMRDIANADQAEFHEGIHRICELFQGLDEWMTKGGFLPTAWTKALNTETLADEAERGYDVSKMTPGGREE